MIATVATATDGFAWVQGWLTAKFGDSLTGHRYLGAWKVFTRYFAESCIDSFSAITRRSCYDYVIWRKTVAHNTARNELRILSAICSEAVNRGLIQGNPCGQLRMRRMPVKLKPELTDAQLEEIAAAIERDPSKHRDFLRTSFMIARYHGCRIAETRLPLSAVNLDAGTVHFLMKGSKEHTVPIHPKLRPMLEKMIRDGRSWTFTEPSSPKYMSDIWAQFLKRHGFKDRIPNVTFHCHRVTVISKLARANISEGKAMRYVSHSSTAIHAIYRRVRLSDLNDCITALA